MTWMNSGPEQTTGSKGYGRSGQWRPPRYGRPARPNPQRYGAEKPASPDDGGEGSGSPGYSGHSDEPPDQPPEQEQYGDPTQTPPDYDAPEQNPKDYEQQEPPPKHCTTCDLGEIDELTCTAKRFARQAEVMNEVATDLETYRTQYDAARKKYTDARDAAVLDLEAIRNVLEELAEQLRCRLTDTQRSCLEQATATIFANIDECTDPPGCQSPCEDVEAEAGDSSGDLDELTAEIAWRRKNLTDSAAYFTALVAEPDDITKQAGDLKQEATQLATDVAGGGDTSKVVRWYARWLILDTAADMSRLGRGFESVSAYIDCLCGVLRCLVAGWTTVAVLEGQKAELECHEDAKRSLCDKTKADPLQAILIEYEACCENEPTPTEAEEAAASA
jgi:hypothetical protein